jgi:hypothetical protein
MLIIHRTLGACIRNLGNLGCPQDLIHKSQYDLLGTLISRAIVQLKRRDDISHRELVSSARALIYQHGAGVRSTAVEAKLFPESLVPTLVSDTPKISSRHSYLWSERIFRTTWTTESTRLKFPDVCKRSDARVGWWQREANNHIPYPSTKLCG